MQIPLEKLNYSFSKKPLLVGGRAMEYYGLRKSGNDIDLIVPERDVINLIKIYPNKLKNLWADLGVCPFEFEIWRSILYFKYDDLLEGSIEEENYLVISKMNLLRMKVLAMEKAKYFVDTKLLVKSILEDAGEKFEIEKSKVSELLKGLKDIVYIEKTGPVE